MLSIEKQTSMKPPEVIERAVKFFGKGGEELNETERNNCCVSFEGGGGYVTVSVTEHEKHCFVGVETREHEYQVKRFLDAL